MCAGGNYYLWSEDIRCHNSWRNHQTGFAFMQNELFVFGFINNALSCNSDIVIINRLFCFGGKNKEFNRLREMFQRWREELKNNSICFWILWNVIISEFEFWNIKQSWFWLIKWEEQICQEIIHEIWRTFRKMELLVFMSD